MPSARRWASGSGPAPARREASAAAIIAARSHHSGSTMKRNFGQLGRWLGIAVTTAALAACGGGGGGSGTGGGGVNAPPDARDGTYILMAANGQEYALTLDFSEERFRIVG